MSSILTCTDGSVYAASVYEHAAWAAGRLGAAVHVLHTIDPHKESASLADLSGSLQLDAREQLMRDLAALDETKARVSLTKGKAILDEAKHILLERGVSDVQLEQRHGTLVDTIAEIEGSHQLIIIGKRGKSADFAKLHLGGNLQRVVRSSHRPVLVASRGFQNIDRFLIAFDGGESARKAVNFAVLSPLLWGLKCHLVMAANEANAEFDAATRSLAEAGFNVTSKVIPGHPEEVIADAVRSKGIDLLVMGAYGHSRIRQLVLGSTTTTMVRTCLVPVLMFR